MRRNQQKKLNSFKKRGAEITVAILGGRIEEEAVMSMSKVMDSEMHQECKAPPKRQVLSHSFSLPLSFPSCRVSTGMFQSSSAYLKWLEKVRHILHWHAPPLTSKVWHTSCLSCSRFKKKTPNPKQNPQTEEICPLLKDVLLLMPEGGGRQHLEEKIMMNLRQLWSPLLWPIRPSLDLGLPAAPLTEGTSCLTLPFRQPLFKPSAEERPLYSKAAGVLQQIL